MPKVWFYIRNWRLWICRDSQPDKEQGIWGWRTKVIMTMMYNLFNPYPSSLMFAYIHIHVIFQWNVHLKSTSGQYVLPDYRLERCGDLAFCPFCIDAFDSRSDGKFKRVMYAIPSSSSKTLLLKPFSSVSDDSHISLQQIPKLHKNRKLSMNEKRRRYACMYIFE